MPKQPRKPSSSTATAAVMPRKSNSVLALQNVPYHITVEKKRKAVDVQSWGSAPFALDDHKNVIPHGFVVKTYYKGKWFTASTRVFPATHVSDCEGGTQPSEEYQFICEIDPVCVGEWSSTSSAALQSVVTKLGPKIKCARGSNGALQIGVTYPNVQQAIRQVFALEGKRTCEALLVLPPRSIVEMRETSEDAVNSSAVVHHNVLSSPSTSTDEDDGGRNSGCDDNDTQSSPSIARTPSPALPTPPMLIAQASHEYLLKRVKHEDDDVDPIEAQFTAKLHNDYFIGFEDDPLMLLGAEDSCDWFHSLMH